MLPRRVVHFIKYLPMYTRYYSKKKSVPLSPEEAAEEQRILELSRNPKGPYSFSVFPGEDVTKKANELPPPLPEDVAMIDKWKFTNEEDDCEE